MSDNCIGYDGHPPCPSAVEPQKIYLAECIKTPKINPKIIEKEVFKIVGLKFIFNIR